MLLLPLLLASQLNNDSMYSWRLSRNGASRFWWGLTTCMDWILFMVIFVVTKSTSMGIVGKSRLGIWDLRPCKNAVLLQVTSLQPMVDSSKNKMFSLPHPNWPFATILRHCWVMLVSWSRICALICPTLPFHNPHSPGPNTTYFKTFWSPICSTRWNTFEGWDCACSLFANQAQNEWSCIVYMQVLMSYTLCTPLLCRFQIPAKLLVVFSCGKCAYIQTNSCSNPQIYM